MIRYIDFNKSYLKWKTINDSEAFFKVENVFEDSFKKETWYLSSSILAGNVYASNGLPKVPMYHFLWSVSSNSNIIFRYYQDKSDHAENKNIFFKNIEIVEKTSLYLEIKSFDDLYNAFDNCKCLLSVVEFKYGKLIFQIKHLNVNKVTSNFQIETGPVFIRLASVYGTYFVHFNDMETIYLSENYPDLSNRYKKIDVSTQFFAKCDL